MCESRSASSQRGTTGVCELDATGDCLDDGVSVFAVVQRCALVLGEQFVRKPKRSQAMLRVGVSASSQSRLRTGSHKSRQQQPECLEARLRKNCRPMEAHALCWKRGGSSR